MNCPECSAVFGPDGLEKSGIVANIKADLATANKLADEACGSAIHARKALEDERARVAALEKGNEEIHTAFSSELEAERTKREQAERELAVVLKANEELNAALSKEAMDCDAALAQVERLRALLKRAMESADEWHDEEYDGQMEVYCPFCHNHQDDGHNSTCVRLCYEALAAQPAQAVAP